MNEENKLQPAKQEVKAIQNAMPQLDAIEMTLMQGDLSKLSTEQRKQYYTAVCDSLGLNRMTQPFAYVTLSGKLTLYARKEATEQLRKINDVSLSIKSQQTVNEIYIVTAIAKMPNGRTDEATGAVSIGGLRGEQLANAVMKAETKAKRRVTLSICGLGFLDESEVSNVDHGGYVSMEDAEGTATVHAPQVLPAAPKAEPAKPAAAAKPAPAQTPAPAPAASRPVPAAAQPTPAPAPVAAPKPAPSVPPSQAPVKQSPYVTLPEDLPPEAPRSAAPAEQPAQAAPEPQISQAQVRRLYTIATSAKWKDAGLKQFMRAALDIDSALQLTPKKYDWLCSVVEQHTFEEAMDILERSQAGKAEAQNDSNV